MDEKILVAYASKYGSTQEAAEKIAGWLQEAGAGVALQPMRAVRSLDGYGLVVLGAPLYFGAWHKDALNFLAQHQEALARRPVAVFALGPTGTGDAEWTGAREMLDEALAKFPWLRPVAVGLFGGRYNPAKLGVLDRLIASLPASPLHGLSASDVRDWEAMRAWAGELVAQAVKSKR